MMRTFIIPLVIVVIFIFGAATLMATAPVLEPTAQTPVPTTVRIRTDFWPALVHIDEFFDGFLREGNDE